MIGTFPTVGCLILIDKLYFTGLDDVLQAFQALIPGSHEATATVSWGEAVLGGEMRPVLLFAQELNQMTAVHIEFDEDEVEGIRQATGLSIEQLFLPYVQAAKAVPGVLAVGVGFELSPPTNLEEETTQEAGIAILFYKDEAHKSWSRRQTMPLGGYYA